MEIRPVARLAIPPMRVRRKRRCRVCGATVLYQRGETLLRKPPTRPLMRSDMAFGDATMPPLPTCIMTPALHEKLLNSGLLGWDWNPAWVASRLSPADIRALVPPFDVTEFEVPRAPCPRRVWEDPLD